MSAFSKALDTTTDTGGKTCTIAKLLAAMPDDDRLDLEAAFAAPQYTPKRIHDALLSLGLVVGRNSVERHKRRHNGSGCKCP